MNTWEKYTIRWILGKKYTKRIRQLECYVYIRQDVWRMLLQYLESMNLKMYVHLWVIT